MAQRSSRSPAPSMGRTWPRWRRSSGARPRRWSTLMTAQPLTVAVVGFSPGFAYLAGLPAALRQVPRRPRPRPVRAGRVGRPGQRARRRLSVGVARGMAAHRPHRRAALHAVGAAVRPPGPRRPRALRQSRPGRPATEQDGRRHRRDGPRPLPRGATPGVASRSSRSRSPACGPCCRTGTERAGRARGPGGRPGRSRLVSSWPIELVGNPVGACTLEITARGPDACAA